jgi:hypothetical protein
VVRGVAQPRRSCGGRGKGLSGWRNQKPGLAATGFRTNHRPPFGLFYKKAGLPFQFYR